MTTAAVFEVRGVSGRVFIYGTHDSYPDGWPTLAVKYIAKNTGKTLNDVAKGVLEAVRKWDYETHMQTADLYNYGGWKETEREVKRWVLNDFRIVKDSDVPKNLEKGWEYWYVVDLSKGTITVKHVKAVMCRDTDEYGGGIYVCGEKELTEFKGTLNEYLNMYEHR